MNGITNNRPIILEDVDLSVDIDLNIATGYGPISIENKKPSHLVIRMSDSRTFREVIRKQNYLRALLRSRLGKLALESLSVDVELRKRVVAEFQNGKLVSGNRIFLFWQYLLAKLGL